jgi:hypothetical protein
VSGYSDGVRVEYAVIKQLKGDGYHISRGSGSKGDLGDVIAIKEGQALFVNVKRTTPPGPKERAQLLAVAACLPGVGVPIVALGPASRVTYRRLTGHGPRDWVRWVPDEVAS